MLGAFATFLKKGSTKNFSDGKVLAHIARSPIKAQRSNARCKPKIKFRLKVFENWGCGGRKAFFKKFSSPTKTIKLYLQSLSSSIENTDFAAFIGKTALQISGVRLTERAVGGKLDR